MVMTSLSVLKKVTVTHLGLLSSHWGADTSNVDNACSVGTTGVDEGKVKLSGKMTITASSLVGPDKDVKWESNSS